MGRGDQKFTIFVSRNIWTPPNNLRSLFRLQCFWRPKTNDYSTFGFEVPHNVYFGAEIPNACHYSTRRDFQTPSLNYSGTSAYEYWTFWHWNSPWLMFWGYVAHPNFHLFAHPNFHLRNEKSLPLILGAEIREKKTSDYPTKWHVWYVARHHDVAADSLNILAGKWACVGWRMSGERTGCIPQICRALV